MEQNIPVIQKVEKDLKTEFWLKKEVHSRLLSFRPYRTLLWKKNMLNDLREFSNGDFGASRLLLDFLSKKRKLENLIEWRGLAKKVATTRYHIDFAEEIPSAALREVLIDNIYFSFPEFIPPPDSTILDIGAQFGDYAILCSKVYGAKKVISFEPIRANYELFSQTLKINSVDNVEVHNAAVSNFNGKLKLFNTSDMGTKMGDGEALSVECLTIDGNITQKADIMKIDVEGFEVEVLEGAEKYINQFKPKIIIETHSRRLKKKVLEFLDGFGYDLRHEGREAYGNVEGADYIQNLYLS